MHNIAPTKLPFANGVPQFSCMGIQIFYLIAHSWDLDYYGQGTSSCFKLCSGNSVYLNVILYYLERDVKQMEIMIIAITAIMMT